MREFKVFDIVLWAKGHKEAHAYEVHCIDFIADGVYFNYIVN